MTQDDATRLFYEHIWPHRAMVLRTARFLTQNHAEADDLAQETLVKAFKFISQFDASRGGKQGDDARSWLSAILRNTWIDRMRSMGRHAAESGRALSIEDHEVDIADGHSEEIDLDARDPAALLEHFSDADMIKALRLLPEEIRWTLMLVDVEQMDQADAAQILGIPEGTVKSRAHRGRRMLRDYLSAQLPADPSRWASRRIS